MRITKVTTKTGDSGETGLGNGERVSKNNPRVHAMGAVDKLNSVIGWTRNESTQKIDEYLEQIQQDLFNLGGELAIPDVNINLLDESRLNWLDEETESLNSTLPPLTEFILPGGNEYASRLHISRAECRESERFIIALSQDEFVPEIHKKYINRLSDFLFILARIAIVEKGDNETSWEYK